MYASSLRDHGTATSNLVWKGRGEKITSDLLLAALDLVKKEEREVFAQRCARS